MANVYFPGYNRPVPTRDGYVSDLDVPRKPLFGSAFFDAGPNPRDPEGVKRGLTHTPYTYFGLPTDLMLRGIGGLSALAGGSPTVGGAVAESGVIPGSSKYGLYQGVERGLVEPPTGSDEEMFGNVGGEFLLDPFLLGAPSLVRGARRAAPDIMPFLKDETGSLRLVGTRDPDIDANAQWLPNSRGQASLYDMIGTAGLAGSTSKKLTRLAHESPQAFLDELSFLVDNSTQDAVRSSIVGGDDAFQHEFYNKRAQRYSQLEADALALISKDNPQFAARYAKDNWRTRQAARVDEDLAMRAERPGETEGGALSRGGVQTWDTPNAYSVEQFEKIRDYLSGMGATIKGKGEIYKALIDFEGPKTPHRILARLKDHADDVPDELYGEMMQAINKMQNKALPDVTDVGSLSNPATFGRGVEKVGGQNPRAEELAMAEDSVFKYAEPGKPSTGYRQPRTLEEMRELPAEGGGPARVGDVFNDGVTNWRVEEATPAGRLVAKNMTTGENTFGWEPAGMERVPGGRVVSGGREPRTLEQMRAEHVTPETIAAAKKEMYLNMDSMSEPEFKKAMEDITLMEWRLEHGSEIAKPPGSIFEDPTERLEGFRRLDEFLGPEGRQGSAFNQEPKQYTDSVFERYEAEASPDEVAHLIGNDAPRVGSAYEPDVRYSSSIFGDQPRAEELPRKTGARPKDVLNTIKKEPKPPSKEYPVAPRSEWWGDADYQARGGEIVEVSPDEFLGTAAPLKLDDVARDNIDDLKAHMQSGRTLDPLVYYGGKSVRDTDGRHRAIAARELGMDKVPVINLSGAPYPEPKGSLMPPETPGRMSKAESEALGYWHPIGAGKRLQKPVHAMSREVEDLPIQPERPADLESMQGGLLLPALGDRTDAGKILTRVGEVPLENPVRLEGGPGFMRDNPEAVWASAKGPATSLLNKARPAIEGGQDAYLGYLPMGHGTANFNMMKTDAVLEQIRGANHSKTAKLMFDRRIRKERPEWPGIDDEDALRMLHENGALRHVFNRVAGMKEFQRRGFPDMSETRYAITDPELLDTPLQHGGQTFGRLTGDIVENPVQPHKTYNTQLEGEYMGGIDHGIPRKLLFPEFYRQRRAAGKPESSDARSFELSKPAQQMDQQWLDNIIEYLTKQRGYSAAAAAIVAEQIWNERQAQEMH